jgi:murein DD-endopeptidase MepM/ murein hydrolase activator NlpD
MPSLRTGCRISGRSVASLRGLGILCLGLASTAGGVLAAEIEVRPIQTSRSVQFEVQNQSYFDVAFRLRMTSTVNMQMDGPEGRVWIVPARSTTLTDSARVVDPLQRWYYTFDWSTSSGDPGVKHDEKARYLLPFSADHLGRFPPAESGPFHHGSYRFTYDFALPTGTTVLAAREGTVAQVVDGWKPEDGQDPRWIARANSVTVRHKDGTYADYVHLKSGRILVREGEPVRAGQPLALSGEAGDATRPMLSFMVWKATPDGGFSSIEVLFGDGRTEQPSPQPRSNPSVNVASAAREQ